MADGYLYRVVGKDKQTGDWNPVSGGFRQQNVRAYDKLSAAKQVRSTWANNRRYARYYSEFRIERTPMQWETVE